MSDAPVPAKLELKADLSAKSLVADDHPEPARQAVAMHNQTIAAANSFHTLFCERHKNGKEANDHYEQDLLRAMLLFSCSGLDATVKQLVRDCLAGVIAKDEGAQGQFAKFIERRLKRGQSDESDRNQGASSGLDYGLLSIILASPTPRATLLNALTQTLTSDSLQSRDQLLKVAGHFALTRDDVLVADDTTKRAFEARNQLAHEMDIDFRAELKRRDRSYVDMVIWSENILAIGERFITGIAAKIGI